MFGKSTAFNASGKICDSLKTKMHRMIFTQPLSFSVLSSWPPWLTKIFAGAIEWGVN